MGEEVEVEKQTKVGTQMKLRECRNCGASVVYVIQTCEIFARGKDEEIQNASQETPEYMGKSFGSVPPRKCFRAMCVSCVRYFISVGEMKTTDIASAPIKEEYIDTQQQQQQQQHNKSSTWHDKDSIDIEEDTEEILNQRKCGRIDNDTEGNNKSKKLQENASDGNSKRKHESSSKKSDGIRFCNRFLRSGYCPFKDDECRFSHDVNAFIQSKEQDLPGVCLWTTMKRICPFGITCRYSSSHPKENGIVDEQDKSSLKGKDTEEEMNHLENELQYRLRRNEISFPKSDVYIKKHGIKVKQAKKRDSMIKISKFCSIKPKDEDNLPDNYRKAIDFRNKLYLAPLTTVGNLPFRRVCLGQGADITCGEMAMATNLLQGKTSEWALLRRHPSEKIFGTQICGGYADTVCKAAELIDTTCEVDFIDINMGCPIDLVVNKCAGSFLLTKPHRIQEMVTASSNVISCPLTFKTRTGFFDGKNVSRDIILKSPQWGAAAVTLHGRTRQQRYTKQADWKYIYDCGNSIVEKFSLEGDKCEDERDFHLIGNGDIYSYEDFNRHMKSISLENDEGAADELSRRSISTVMIARGALIKPWLFREIKEQRHIDISSGERFDLIKEFVNYGLQHWGCDSKGVETTRRFLLEWMGFLHRYVPYGLLEITPPQLHWRPGRFYGRNDLETMLGSTNSKDWIKLSEMLLGKAPLEFEFQVKHKSNSYEGTSNG